MSGEAAGTPSPTLVLLFGITQRSGTNLLYRALLQHPGCLPARQPGEDFLFHEAQLLTKYVDRVSRHWNPAWDEGGRRTADLLLGLGRGLVSHLRPDAPCGAFVSKTPSVRNIGLVRRIIPEAKCLIVVRDGRDVVESGVRGFGWTYGEGFRRWARAADELVRFLDSDEGSAEIIRFEALVRSPHEEVARALDACGLPRRTYPFATLDDLPVYGSSVVRAGRDEVHWNPVEKPEGFDPIGRWKSWDQALKLRYERACGRVAERLGYGTSSARPERGLSGLARRVLAWLDRR